jgi:3-hydroxyisobutyrate dehydrogenase-like beta-hydroxyacid dehydrogenase
MAHGFETHGFDIDEKRLVAFEEMGGIRAVSPAQLGAVVDAAFVMVMDGNQAKSVILGEGLMSKMSPGNIVLLTATINPPEARDIAEGLSGSGIGLIDSPVSGGFPGAQGGTLTMMAAAPAELLDQARPVMAAVSKTIHRVGDAAGMGQTVKACLQTLIGSIFSATFEAASLAAKAGVDGQVLFDVFSTSGAGCGVANTALENIIDRKFEGTGSHIGTMYKDLTIALDMGRSLGVPLFTAATAMQLFQAGITKYPTGDNWVVTRISEEIVGAELHR